MLTTLLTMAKEAPQWVKVAKILVVAGIGCQKADSLIRRMKNDHKQKKRKNDEV